MRRLDPHRTPQELQPAKVPTVLIFSLGTLAWLAALVVVGARRLLGYTVDGRIAAVCVAGVLIGVVGLAWALVHNRRHQPDTQATPDPTTAHQPEADEPVSTAPQPTATKPANPTNPETQDQP